MHRPAPIPLANPVARHWNWQGGARQRRRAAGTLPETVVTWPKHGFTHVDAPCHMIRNGPTLDDCALEQLCGEAALVDVGDRIPDRPVDGALLEARGGHVRQGDILILRSNLHRRYPNTTPEYWSHAPWLADCGSRWLVERGCTALAVDFPQDRVARELGHRAVANAEFREHQIVLGAGLMHLEHAIDLHRIEADRCFLLALPLRLPGADGGPAGPVALTRWPSPRPRITDLTRPLAAGDRVRLWLEKSFDRGDPVQETGVEIDGQVDTHLLAPRYLDPAAPAVADIPAEARVGPAVVADLSGIGPDTAIDPATLAARLPGGDPGAAGIVVLSARRGSGAATPWLGADAAAWLADRGVRMLAADFELDAGRRRLAGAPARAADLDADAVLLARGVARLRNLQGLAGLRGDRPWIAALPLCLPGAESAPARVVALEW